MVSPLQQAFKPFAFIATNPTSLTYSTANMNPNKPSNYYPVGLVGTPNYGKTALQYWLFPPVPVCKQPYRPDALIL